MGDQKNKVLRPQAGKRIRASCRKNKPNLHCTVLYLRQKVGNYCKILLTSHDKKNNSAYQRRVSA
jgi:hypothetical protein